MEREYLYMHLIDWCNSFDRLKKIDSNYFFIYFSFFNSVYVWGDTAARSFVLRGFVDAIVFVRLRKKVVNDIKIMAFGAHYSVKMENCKISRISQMSFDGKWFIYLCTYFHQRWQLVQRLVPVMVDLVVFPQEDLLCRFLAGCCCLDFDFVDWNYVDCGNYYHRDSLRYCQHFGSFVASFGYYCCNNFQHDRDCSYCSICACTRIKEKWRDKEKQTISILVHECTTVTV